MNDLQIRNRNSLVRFVFAAMFATGLFVGLAENWLYAGVLMSVAWAGIIYTDTHYSRKAEKWRRAHRTHEHVRRFLLSVSSSNPLSEAEGEISSDVRALTFELLAGGEGVPPGIGPFGKSEVQWAIERTDSNGYDGLNGLLELCRLGSFECVGGEWPWSDKFMEEVYAYWRASPEDRPRPEDG